MPPWSGNGGTVDIEHGRTADHVKDLQSGLRPEDESGFPLTGPIAFMLEREPGHAPWHRSQG